MGVQRCSKTRTSCPNVHAYVSCNAGSPHAGAMPAMPELDIIAMLEAWLHDVQLLCTSVQQLAGDMAGPTGKLCMTPLVATPDAVSHAPHLNAQLGIHMACMDHLRSLKVLLKSQLTAAGKLHPECAQAWLSQVSSCAAFTKLFRMYNFLELCKDNDSHRMPSDLILIHQSTVRCIATPPNQQLTLMSLACAAAFSEELVDELQPQVEAMIEQAEQKMLAEAQAAQQLAAQYAGAYADHVPSTATTVDAFASRQLDLIPPTPVLHQLFSRLHAAHEPTVAAAALQQPHHPPTCHPAAPLQGMQADTSGDTAHEQTELRSVSPSGSVQESDDSIGSCLLVAADVSNSTDHIDTAGSSGTAPQHDGRPDCASQLPAGDGSPGLVFNIHTQQAACMAGKQPSADSGTPPWPGQNTSAVTETEADVAWLNESVHIPAGMHETASASLNEPAVQHQQEPMPAGATSLAASLDCSGGSMLESPALTDADWLSSAKPRRLSYSSFAETVARNQDARQLPQSAATEQQVPTNFVTPAVSHADGGQTAGGNVTLLALRERFTKVKKVQGPV